MHIDTSPCHDDLYCGYTSGHICIDCGRVVVNRKSREDLVSFGLSTSRYASMINDRSVAALLVNSMEQ